MSQPIAGQPLIDQPLIEMRGIAKSFGAVRALHGVDLRLDRGEVLGLVGDNAAGKSTLMKILAGAYSPDDGEIRIDGVPVKFDGPISARDSGIEMIYQDFALVPQLTVAQNIFLGRELMTRRFGLPVLDRRSMADRSRDLFSALGLRVPSVDSPVHALSGGQQQAVAIARATGFAAKLVIMDEPTANLGAPAIAKVRETISRLKRSGVAVIVISHRLEDIFAVGDHFMVMKHGRLIASRAVDDTHADEIVEMIVSGRDRRVS
ncbi:sugar ABC transporter ATP-binding protein [Skermanella aerolata]|uniref:Sugar ABC transporter ATP-binding protein n=1 Tax=Skermanella aerolata TaxID=393310 RepID=A0A512DIV0_9PROT|nr:ATP-binding cassette domain-containing protein [Skermanella aerolata]GEO36404.1 sugar ABC transporter ATP-binding protein [Skermanella aerolata]